MANMAAPLGSALALGALGVLGYTYFGYPLAVAALAKLSPMPTRRDPTWEPRVSVLMPAMNAEAHIAKKLDSLLAQDWPKEKLEIVVYSDGSSDRTDDIVRGYEGRGVRLLRGDERRGKPSALNAMRAVATGEVFLLCDVRQMLAPGAIRALCAALADPDVGTVSGNLVLEGAHGAGVYWKYEKAIRQAESRYRGMLGATGALYAMRAADFPASIPEDVLLDDVWIPFTARLKGKKLLFEEDAVAYEAAFEDDREFGRKVRTLAGNWQLFAKMPALLDPKQNPSFFELVSHKGLRLVGPFAMGALAVGTAVALARGEGGRTGKALFGALAAGQLGFAALTALGERAGAAGRVARTFVVMNQAAAVGLFKYVQGGQRITW
jgi:biofilm PGA synthesis N-glycosyltransferase PgaC